MKEFLDRYKIVIFITYALVAGLIFIASPFVWWKVLLYIPMGVFGGYLLWKIFPRSSEEHLTVVRVNGDGSVLITKSAVSRSVTDAVKVIQEVKYVGCEVENSRTGINIVIHIKVLESKVVETSEVVKEFVKNLLEEELNVKVNKIDIVVKKAQYSLKVKKIDPNKNITVDDEEERSKKSKTNKAIQNAEKAMAPVSEFNSEYSFAVGNEKKRVVVRGGDEEAKSKSTSAAEYPKTISNAGKPASVQTKTVSPAYPIVPKTVTPPPAEHGTLDLKAELARRKAERDALLAKINSDSNKLN